MAENLQKIDNEVFNDAIDNLQQVLEKNDSPEMSQAVESMVANNNSDKIQEVEVAESTQDLKQVLKKEDQPEMEKAVDAMEKENQDNIVKEINNLLDSLSNVTDTGQREAIIGKARGLASQLPGEMKQSLLATIENAEEKAKANEASASLKASSAGLSDTARAEAEAEAEFNKNLNNFSNYFDKEKLNHNEFNDIAKFMDDEENRKKLKQETEPHLDNFNRLAEKEKNGGLSEEERAEKNASHKKVRNYGNAHIVHNAKNQAEEHGHDEETTLKIANKAKKKFGKINLEGKSIDEIEKLAKEVTHDAHASVKEKKQARAVLDTIEKGEFKHDSQDQIRSEVFETIRHVNEDNKEPGKLSAQKNEVKNSIDWRPAEIKTETKIEKQSTNNSLSNVSDNLNKQTEDKSIINPETSQEKPVIGRARRSSLNATQSQEENKSNNLDAKKNEANKFEEILKDSNPAKDLLKHGAGKIQQVDHKDKSPDQASNQQKSINKIEGP